MKLFTRFLFLKLLIILTVYYTTTNAEENMFVAINTSMGKIELELLPEASPVTVKNFLSYVKKGYYDGTIFHRVIDGFMIQGGGFTADMTLKKTNPPIKNESSNQVSNLRGTISMARTNNPDSATSQFFINHVDNLSLDSKNGSPGYTVFGKVTQGIEVVDKIAKVKTTNAQQHQNTPQEPVIIKQIKLLKAQSAPDRTAETAAKPAKASGDPEPGEPSAKPPNDAPAKAAKTKEVQKSGIRERIKASLHQPFRKLFGYKD